MNLSVTADAVPPPLSRGGFGSPRKVNGFARGSPTRGNGQQDASDSEADAGCRNPALSNGVRLRGCTKTGLPSAASPAL